MNSEQDREELLSSYVDGELSERRMAEVKYLAERDPTVARRIRQLNMIKGLVGALPRQEASFGLDERVKALLGQNGPLGRDGRTPALAVRARVVRLWRIRAAAAVVLLAAGLSVLVYSVRKPTVPGLSESGHLETAVTQSVSPQGPRGLVARLELGSSAFSAVDSSVGRAIEYNGLAPYTDKLVEKESSAYHIRSSRRALAAFLRDISHAWPKFEQASLRLTTRDFGAPLILDGVSATQMQEIFGQKSASQSVALARRLAVENSMEQLRLADGLLALSHEQLDKAATVANPMLTSRSASTSPASVPVVDPAEWTELTIVLRPGKD